MFIMTNEAIEANEKMDAPFNNTAENIYRLAGKYFDILSDNDVRDVLVLSKNINVNDISLTFLGVTDPLASAILLYRQLMN